MRKRRNRIPRPVKAIFCAVCAVLLAFLYYIALGSPTFTFEQEFRRAEKANLVGPSRIVDTLEGEYAEFDKMIVGETEHGICFFGGEPTTMHYGSNFQREEMTYTFSYREKTGNITVLAAPNRTAAFWEQFDIALPVYVFDCYPEAVRAELTLTITGIKEMVSDGNPVTTKFSKRFSVAAERTGDGFFRFLLNAKAHDTNSVYALQMLSDLSGNELSYTHPYSDAVIPGTIRLYDESNKLILEQEFEICSAAAAAHK